MPVQWETIDIGFGGGLDTKVAKEMLPNGRLRLLENAVQELTGEVRKRPGFTAKSTDIIGGGTIDSARKVLASGQAIAIQSDGNVYSHGSVIDEWRNTGAFTRVDVAAKTLAHMTSQWEGLVDEVCDAVRLGDYEFVMTDHSWIVYDASNGSVLSNVSGLSILGKMRGIPLTDRFGWLVDVNGGSGTLQYNYILVPSMTVGAPVNLTTSLAAAAPMDGVEYDATRVVVAYAVTSALQITVVLMDKDGTNQSTHLITPGGGATVEYVSLAVDSSGNIYVAYEANDEVRIESLDSGLSSRWTATLDSSGNPKAPGCVLSDDEATLWVTYTDHNASDRKQNNVKYGGVATASGTVTTSARVLARGLTVRSKPFIEREKIHVLAKYTGQELPRSQCSLFLVDEDGEVVCRVFAGNASPSNTPSTGDQLRSVSSLGDNKWMILGDRRGVMDFSTDTTEAVDVDLVSLVFDFAQEQTPSVAKTEAFSDLAGGYLASLTPARLYEHGFHVYPEEIALTEASGGSMPTTGTYDFIAMYHRITEDGVDWFSAPSPAESITLTSSNQTVEVVVPTLRLGKYLAGVNILVFRTANGGDTFYLAGVGANNPSAATVQIDVDNSDTDLVQNQQPYTAGGELEHIAPPAPRFISADGDRLFVVPADEPSRIWPSKPALPGRGVQFSDTTTIYIPAGGDIVALGHMDGRHYVFKEKEIRYFSGDGPNLLGQGGYTRDEQIASDVGCRTRSSVIATPLGLMFQSHKGICLLDRSGTVQPIGAPVDSYNSDDILDAMMRRDRREVLFLQAGRILAFDYYHQTWSVWSRAVDDVSLAEVNGKIVIATDDGTVHEEDATRFWDDRENFIMRVRTAWVRVGALMGYQRCRRFALLGSCQTDCTITVDVYTDYDESTAAQTVSFAASPGILRHRSRMEQQKCESVMFEISVDASNEVGSLEGARLAGLSLEIGRKPGLRRLPAALTGA